MTVRILVRGSNDTGSAVAHTLFRAGYAVVIHEVPQPAITNTKIIEVDPRSACPQITGISEKPARIARGVLFAIQSWEATCDVD